MPDASRPTLIFTDTNLRVTLTGTHSALRAGQPPNTTGKNLIGSYLPDLISALPREEILRICEDILAGKRFEYGASFYRKIIPASGCAHKRTVLILGPHHNPYGDVDGIQCMEFKSGTAFRKPGNHQPEQIYACLVENASDIICMADTNGIITFINHRVRHYEGLKVEDFLGKHFSELVHPDDIESASENITKTLAGIPLNDYSFRFILPNGLALRMVANGQLIDIDGHGAIVLIIRDVTESIELNQKLVARNRALSALNQIVVALSGSLPIDDALQTVLEHILSELDLKAGTILLREYESKMKIRASVGFDGEKLYAEWRQLPVTISEQCAEMGEMIIVSDINDESVNPLIREKCKEFGIEAVIALPLRCGENLTAVLSLSVPRMAHLTLEQMEFLSLATGMLGPAIVNAQLNSDLADRVNQLAMMERLAKSINSERDVHAVLDTCMKEIAGLINYDMGVVVLLNQSGEADAFMFTKGGKSLPGNHVALDAEQLGHITGMSGAVIVPDTHSISKFHRTPDLFVAESGCGAVVPLVSKERMFGLLKVWSLSSEGFGSRETAILETAAEHLSIAAYNAMLYEAERAKSMELHALTKEAQHRIKNNLQMIAGLLTMADDGAQPAKNVVERCLRQVQAIATVHELLSLDDISAKIQLGECLTRIAQSALTAMGNCEHIEIEVNGGSGCMLTADTATAVGMIVNELVSNAVEHAFIGREKGKIEVKVIEEGKYCVVEVIDDGAGLLPDFTAPGFACSSSGLGLVSALAEYGLGGKLEIESGDKGTRAKVSF